MSEEQREPTEEELRAALEEQMKRITVHDVLLQTVVTLVNLRRANSVLRTPRRRTWPRRGSGSTR